jgi:dihydroflavonol-4-reductase
VRVGVTGASGHVGGALCRALLERGDQVSVLVHSDAQALTGLAVERVTGDLCEAVALDRVFAGCQRIFHLAARISLDSRDRPALERVNVLGTAAVVDACLRARVARLVHFSSIHAFSSVPLDQPIDETRPRTAGVGTPAYDLTKALAEREVERGISAGLDAVVVNPTAIVGPFDFRPSPMGEVLIDLYRGRFPGLVDGGFDWVDVRDVVAGALAAADRGRAGERYLLSGARRSVRQVADLVTAAGGRAAPWFTSPMWMARAAAPLALSVSRLTGKRARFTPDSLHALRNHLDVRHDKATRELGYQPRPLEETVADTIGWFKQNGRL